MNARLNEIKKHAEHTFEWVFESTNEDISSTLKQQLSNMSISPPNIAEWFRTGRGIYLILGKPGAGKSTFMKFLSRDSRVRDALEEWSGTSETVLLFHSFWGLSEKPPAHNWKGFLASLAYQLVLSNAYFVMPGKGAPFHKIDYNDWSIEDLQDFVFRAIKTSSGRKHCILIDALDEAEPDQISDIFKWIRETTKDLHDVCKICLASRRLSSLDTRFFAGSMELDRFTPKDLQIYAKTRLHNAISELPDTKTFKQQAYLDHFVDHLCCKAEGVWIWMYHALMRLENDIQLSESFDLWQLEEAIDILPRDLYNLYRQSLARSRHKFPHKEKQRLILLALGHFFPCPLFQVFIALNDKERFKYLETKMSGVDDARLSRLCNTFKKQIFELSGCLIESTSDRSHYEGMLWEHDDDNLWLSIGKLGDGNARYMSSSTDTTQIRSWEMQPWRMEIVRYVHRTVYEYLTQEHEISADPSPHMYQLVIESGLACFIESVLPLNSHTLEDMRSHLHKLKNDTCTTVRTIGKTCQYLLATRVQLGEGTLFRMPLVPVDDESWLHLLLIQQDHWDVDWCYLDYTGFLFRGGIRNVHQQLFEQNKTNWSSYYRGYLALCTIGLTIFHPDSPETLFLLQKSGADLEAKQISPCSQDLNLYRSNSCIDRLLTKSFIHLVNHFSNPNGISRSTAYLYQNLDNAIKLVDGYDLATLEIAVFISCHTDRIYIEDWMSQNTVTIKRGRVEHPSQYDIHDWNSSMVLVTFNANEIKALSKHILAGLNSHLLTFKLTTDELASNLLPIASKAYILLVDGYRKDCRWIQTSDYEKDYLLKAALLKSRSDFLSMGGAIARRKGENANTMPQSFVQVPKGVRPLPLDPRAEIKNGRWEEVCALRDYYSTLPRPSDDPVTNTAQPSSSNTPTSEKKTKLSRLKDESSLSRLLPRSWTKHVGRK